MSATELGELVSRLLENGIDAQLSGGHDTVVDDVFHDSASVRPGGLFCCVVGAHADGHDHAAAAVDGGATALVTQRALDLGVPEIRVAEVRDAMGHLATAVHDDPSTSLRCVGVTGTNGKTTTVSLIADVARAAGIRTGVIGTLSGARTTPEAPELQRLLAGFRDEGCGLVAMEVSSHALAQGRVAGTRFAVSAFTNLSPEHLDYHGTMEAYFRAKARLFDPDLSERAVVGIDDPHGRLLADAAKIPTHGFGLADAAPIHSLAPASFTWRGGPVRMHLAGAFNVANAMAAASVAAELGIDDVTIRGGLEKADVVPGRFEQIDVGQPFVVVVDFAHTPDSITQVLGAARQLAENGRVLVAFGAGGDRDVAKRPSMGAAAGDGADVVVITSDNPRHEDPGAIIAEIRSGLGDEADVLVEPDRRAAIATLLDEAREGDVVVIAGKGHESTQIVGDRSVSFDDREVARELLVDRGWSA